MFEIRPLNEQERKYTYSQSLQIEAQTGLIGYLRGEFPSDGQEVCTTWIDRWAQWKTQEFQDELVQLIHTLFSDQGLLKDKDEILKYGGEHPDTAFQGRHCTEYGVRVDTAEYVYLLRCNPSQSYFFCFCYAGERLDEHIKRAERGIRFVDYCGGDLFRLQDGDKIVVTEDIEYKCRFIDETHVEVGRDIYHINEFAEKMHDNGAVYRPLKEKKIERQEVQSGNKKNKANSQKVR